MSGRVARTREPRCGAPTEADAGPVGGFLTAWTEMGLSAATDINGRLWGRRVYIPLVLR